LECINDCMTAESTHANGGRAGWWPAWKARHRHPASLALHAVGIPLTVWALILAGWQLREWRWDLWWRPALLFVAGYVLQWIGHRIEGNTMGEVILLNRWLGRPYVAVSPRYLPKPKPGPGQEPTASSAGR
jgi:hypothetical protein